MNYWKRFLKGNAVDWLLETDNPSVRYLTLTNILGKKQTDAEVKKAKKEIMLSGVVPSILARQREGRWNDPGRFYTDKYRGTVWQLIILAEHEADGSDPRIAEACEYILRSSQDPESCGFAYHQRGKSTGGRHSEVVPCLTGNMVWSLIKLGRFQDDRVAKGVAWITDYQRFDDGVDAHLEGWPYEGFEMCWGRHSCHMGVVKSLKALSALPAEARNKRVSMTIDRGCRYLLDHHIYKQSHNPARTSKPGFRKLQFPLMYQTDVLEMVDILLEFEVRDERMQEAVDLIVSKQNDHGIWTLEATFNGRFQVDIEANFGPSKWITYRALKVLKRYYEAAGT